MTFTKTHKVLAIMAAILLAATGLFLSLSFAQKVGANQSRLQTSVQCSTQGTSATSLATTSVTYLDPLASSGTSATSTITCNMATAGGGVEVFNTAALNIVYKASTTDSTLGFTLQGSPDGVDWFELDNTVPTLFSTANAIEHASTSVTNRWRTGDANASTSLKSVAINTLGNKYLRVQFFVTPGATRGSVWANLIGKTELNY